MKFSYGDKVKIIKSKWSKPEKVGVVNQRIIPRAGNQPIYNVKVGSYIYTFKEYELEKAS